ncbi:hypothetical protein, partial [Pedobacter sp. ASV28]|uniref:hypothetical protein n=1 Tax=Pedobacter sp. ASV28 TaxID=2795123 RepID=UPI0018ED0250
DFDKDAENFIYASGINNPANLNVDGLYTSEQAMYAVNYLVSGLKAIGVWDKIKAIYPFVGGTADMHKWNLKDPRDLDAAFRIVWNGTITHNGYGVKGDGSTGSGNTYLIPATHIGNVSRGGMCFYSGTSGYDSAFRSDCGTIGDGSSNTFRLTIKRPDGQTLAGVNSHASATIVNDGSGCWLLTKPSTQGYLFVNGLQYNWNSSSATFNSTLYPVTILRVQSEYSQRQCRYFHIDEGLSITESQGLSKLIISYQGILNRKV